MSNYDYENLNNWSLTLLNDLENHLPSTMLNYLTSQKIHENYDDIDKQIPIKELEIGHWYGGVGRCANEGRWDGERFSVIGTKGRRISHQPQKWVNVPEIRGEFYYGKKIYDGELGNLWGSFQPLLRIIDENKLAELSLVFNDVSAIDSHKLLSEVSLEFHNRLGIKRMTREESRETSKSIYAIEKEKHRLRLLKKND
jgi:hypothetical protein